MYSEKNILSIFLLIFSLHMATCQTFIDFPGCVRPPFICPNDNITFWLYTKANVDSPYQLFLNDTDNLRAAPWVADAPFKFLIHGYTGWKDYSPSLEIRPALLSSTTHNYNVISVDYEPLARSPCYLSAKNNTELVGKCLAELIDNLVRNLGVDLNRFHLIGFSLGAHVAGFAGQYLESGEFSRMTLLDPALPLFVTRDRSQKADATDAVRVDCLHTNALQRGKLERCGSSDFYANGGMSQPGCPDTEGESSSSCSHQRAPEFYAESINTDVGFYAFRMNSWVDYLMLSNWADLFSPARDVLYGEHMDINIDGVYHFTTNEASPYAQGES